MFFQVQKFTKSSLSGAESPEGPTGIARVGPSVIVG